MSEEKKIIIDEDWKTRVQAEKEAADSQPESKPAPAAAEGSATDDFQMPPASFELLLSTLASEAMMSLGVLAPPGADKPMYRPNQAKYLIDTIEVLRDKTKGNLTPAESKAVEDMLHQLRLIFVEITARPPGSASTLAGDAETSP
jgi:hypothetical protein